MDKLSTIYSTHTFLLPLKWDYLPGKNSLSHYNFEVRTDITKVHECLKGSGWQRQFYRINESKDYNEFVYFHDYVRKAIFDQQEKEEHQSHSSNSKNTSPLPKNKFMAYYEYNLGKNSTYTIETKSNSYTLHLKSICLHIFSTGVLILSIDCENKVPNQSDPASILQINEFGRRIYPQFLGPEEPRTAQTKNTFLAKRIILNIDYNDSQPFIEDFSRFDQFTNIYTKGYYPDRGSEVYKAQNVIQAPKFIALLFNNNFIFNAHEHNKGKIRLSRVLDDRMFFICWYGNPKMASELATPTKIIKKYIRSSYKYMPNYATNPFWYCFMFGDKSQSSPTIQDDNLQFEHVQKHTYSRWYDLNRKSNLQYSGTIFGLTRDSFVCIGDTFVLPHIQTMYYQISVLCLAQRSTALKYSGEVANLTLMKNRSQKLVHRIRSLHLHYVEFINKLYFREVTSQLQGIELYNQLQDVMQIHRDVKDLDSEIQELHSYVTMYEQSLIARITTIGVPFAIVFGILGANIFQNEMKLTAYFDWHAIGWILIGITISFLIGQIIPIFTERKI